MGLLDPILSPRDRSHPPGWPNGVSPTLEGAPLLTDISPIAPTTTQPAAPLSPDHFRELADTRCAAAKVRRAAGIASFSGWSMAVFGAITLVGGVLGDVVSLVLGIGLGAIAWNELRGSAKLKRFDPSGARVLGFNQIGLGALIVAYAAWSLKVNLGSSSLASLSEAGLDPSQQAMIGDIAKLVTYAVYGGLIIVGFIVPGLTAWYYFSRGRIVRRFIDRTPPWILDTLRAAA